MTQKNFRALAKIGQMSCIASVTIALAGCEEGKEFNLFKPKNPDSPAIVAPVNSGSTKLVERDIEAPEAFHVIDNGLWDGRPSLGGVWVAHADVTKPDRVIIRNKSNGKFIIGALFRRERENPGPRFQVSSDAANTLGMLAGQPAKLDVTALHRKEVPKEVEPTAEAAPDPKEQAPNAPEKIEESKLDPIASAAAAIEAADSAASSTARPAPNPANDAAPAAVATTTKPLFSMSKPYIQVGLFKEEESANNAAEILRISGIEPEIAEQTSGEETVWRIVVGPAVDRAERRILRKQIKDLGFTDSTFAAN